jgi:hypothetical protein
MISRQPNELHTLTKLTVVNQEEIGYRADPLRSLGDEPPDVLNLDTFLVGRTTLLRY